MLYERQTLPTCWLQYYWQRSWSHFFVQFPVFDMVVRKLGNILMKKRNIRMLCQSDYLAKILPESFFRVYGECSANHFLTNIFIHTKLHQHGGGQNVFGCLRQWHKSKFPRKHSLQTQQLYWSHILPLKLFRKCPKFFQNTFFSRNSQRGSY